MPGFVTAARRLAKGIRTGNVGLTALGAVMAAVAVVKATSGPRRELVYVAKLRRGQEIKVAYRAPDQPSR